MPAADFVGTEPMPASHLKGARRGLLRVDFSSLRVNQPHFAKYSPSGSSFYLQTCNARAKKKCRPPSASDRRQLSMTFIAESRRRPLTCPGR
jgi:hypothetical protein